MRPNRVTVMLLDAKMDSGPILAQQRTPLPPDARSGPLTEELFTLGSTLLLEALAGVAFPVNPQIYHDAAVVSRFADGHEASQAITLVEFPAYAGKLEEVRRSLAAFGFDPVCIQVTAMLEEIQSDTHTEPIPPGAEYVFRYRVKRRAMMA